MVHKVTVMSRAGCHLCEVAEADVARICGELGVPWETSDVDSDPEWRAEYGDQVPVILIDGAEHGYWRVEEERFRRALA
ncbi:glutaredoxin family protein [Amycolatopsis sulphurea]|uniref:glutaredoxin family protein n=1 Tax=Amycolatopsis sulphurea TaxID=76022 RepID=UPI000BF71F4D|nr:glutaredoxin family protein [Amycolatopsis sulphurea]